MPDHGRASSPSRPGDGTGEERAFEARRERIRRATEAGGLPGELPSGFGDPEDGDWRIAFADEDPFEQLYLDYRQHEDITSEMVRRHYQLISDFWKKKVRTLDSGVEQQARQIRRKYGGAYDSAERVREHLEQTTRAYGLLSDADGREACRRELRRTRREKGREALLPVLRPSLRSGVLAPPDVEELFDAGRQAGLREEDVAKFVMGHLRERGFGPESWPEGDTRAAHLRSVRWMTRQQHRQAATPETDPLTTETSTAAASPTMGTSAGERATGRAATRETEGSSEAGATGTRRKALIAGAALLALVLLVGGGVLLFGAPFGLAGFGGGSESPSQTRTAQEEEAPPFPVEIDTERLSVRDGPSTGHDVLATLDEGERLDVLDTRDGWQRVRVRTDDGQQRTGWVHADRTRRTSDAASLPPTLADEETNTPKSDASPNQPQAKQQATRRDRPPQNEQAAPSGRQEASEERGGDTEADAGTERASSRATRPPSSSGRERSGRAADGAGSSSSRTVFRKGAVDQDPQMLGSLSPDYPDFAKRAEIEGTVVLQFVVSKDGRVQNVNVLRSPHDALSKAAVAEMREARFRPGRKDGTPVSVRMSRPLRFRIQ